MLSPPTAGDDTDLSGSVISSTEVEHLKNPPPRTPATPAPKADPGKSPTTQTAPHRDGESRRESIATAIPTAPVSGDQKTTKRLVGDKSSGSGNANR